MQRFICLMMLMAGLAEAGKLAKTITVGDGTVDGLAIGEYQFDWQQCLLQDGSWVDGGRITENATLVGERLRLTQSTTGANGVHSISTTWFDQGSLAPLRMELEVTGPDGKQLASAERDLGPNGYTGEVRRAGEEPQQVSGSISSKMYNGAILGLPLATLDFAAADYRFDASMMMFDASYRVIATSAGTEQLVHDGRSHAVRLVDVEWRHENGDVYPAGPDASGGRYWLLEDAAEDLPRVIRYKTDSYAVEYLTKFCPATG